MKLVSFILIFISLSACSSMTKPSSSLIDAVPVVKVGEKRAIPKDHIVFIPANTPFPIHFEAKGSLFAKDVKSTVMTRLKQDIYLYKRWASLDGKKWINSHRLINVQPSGGFDSSGGKMVFSLDLVH